MKRCPECRRNYHDDSLSFCLDDGTLLVDGPATDESATAIQPTRESKTVLMPATSDSGTPPTDNSISNSLSRRKTMIAALVVALMALAGGIGFAVYKFRTPEPAVYAPFQTIKIERLTSNGKATQAVISPDGKQVVYVLDDAGKRSLWLRQVATATDVQLTPPTNEVFYWSLTISRDGNYLYYVYGGTIRNRILYQMPLIGG
ncbi:MAG: hypothetical protein ABI481_05015, partial [Pyrinomonadaceae bacterium]